ncbi:Uncharacterised protein [Kluyvera cryocrescens]|uniref:Uncharacterized protein n=1 Tax=Kluyvera cryocrescens TaxID=580 RepID=A0A485AT50_KLUCR|nr:Uncharacterised protein [Kluyvera cryocrescens]
MTEFTKERIIEELKASTQNASVCLKSAMTPSAR